MRIVHVIGNIEAKAGGPTAVLATMARCQTRLGLDVSVISGFDAESDPKSPSPIRAAGVPVLLVGPVRGPLEAHPNLTPILEGRIADADVVHFHGIWEEILYRASRICRRRGVPYVMTPHGMLDRWSLRRKWLKKQVYLWWRLRTILRQAAAVHTSSRAEQEEVQRLHLAPRVFVQPYGIDRSETAALPPPGTFRRRHGLGNDQPLTMTHRMLQNVTKCYIIFHFWRATHAGGDDFNVGKVEVLRGAGPTACSGCYTMRHFATVLRPISYFC